MNKKKLLLAIVSFAFVLISCSTKDSKKEGQTFDTKMGKRLANYAKVELTADLSSLSVNQKEILTILFDASDIIDEIFWYQTYGDKEALYNKIKDENTLKYVNINYGPWDRLKENTSFVEGIYKKPEGSNLYPHDITYVEFENLNDIEKYNPYTILRRNELGGLQTIPYHKAYNEKLEKIAQLLNTAATKTNNANFKEYLSSRADALLSDDFYKSNIAWMKMKNNTIDIIIGPIEDTEDRLFWTKTTYQSMVLIKDKKSSEDLEKYSLLLPYLQKNLPVDPKYITDIQGKLSDIMVYNVIYCKGFWNAGSKKIAITLPKDGQVQLKVGSRKLQFKNVMEAKFEKILKPISGLLIDKEQQKHVKFQAFFENTMFYEIGSALGLNNTIKGETVRNALAENYNIIEESKNDILSLFFITKLYEMGELSQGDIMDNYVTYMADIFRSVRFGISNDQGVANVMRFNYFEKEGAFTRDKKTGTYSVNFDNMKSAMLKLAEEILTIQGEGDYIAAKKLIDQNGYIKDDLLNDLYRIQYKHIPKDICFIQGKSLLDL